MSLLVVLTGQSSVASIGDPAPLPHLSLVFSETTSTHTLTAEQGTYSLSGQDAGGAHSGSTPAPLPSMSLLGGLGSTQPILVAESGTYTVSGQDAGLARTWSMAADYGTYATSGQVAALVPSEGFAGEAAPLPHIGLLLAPVTDTRTLVCDPGLYSIIGSDGLADFEMSAAQGSYALAGQDAALLRSIIFACDAGTYEVTGQTADFAVGGTDRTMPADTTTYAITGFDATLTVARTLTAEQGFFAQLGQAAEFFLGLLTHYTVTAESGTYASSGQDAAFEVSEKLLECEFGSYSVQGYSIPDPPGQSRQGAGKSKRPRKKMSVEIDGEVFAVDSREEAEMLLAQAKEAAEEQARLTVERAVKAERRPTRKVLGDARKALKAPEIVASEELVAEAEALTKEIEAIYQDAMVKVEIAALMRREEEDEEEALLLLL
jgi:hypothetical protein